LLKKINLKDVIWIDLNNVSEEIKEELEDFLNIYIQKTDEIETRSRYIQTNHKLIVNSLFLQSNYVLEPVSFILKNNILISVRREELKSFNETIKKVYANPDAFHTGQHILVSLFEVRVDYDADIIETLTEEITILSKSMSTSSDKPIGEDILIEIKDLQEKVMIVRQNTMDKQRVVSSMVKGSFFEKDLHPRLEMTLKEINSLFEYTHFGFERLDYLQDTFMGLVNIQQSKIIKIFTVVSVIFMPPTLIASIYGMNFDVMPELHWQLGYVFSLGTMVLSVAIVLVLFKRKKWL
jgi:magnesium transporter